MINILNKQSNLSGSDNTKTITQYLRRVTLYIYLKKTYDRESLD